jgi:methyltransferase of ATP-grasp peptide maturase system
MTEDTAPALRRALAEDLAAQGLLGDRGWRAAVEAVPRELFLGDAFFRAGGQGWEPVRREQVGAGEWLRLAYSDATWVTQVDGMGADLAEGPVNGRPTSSSTLPSLVVRMLETAGVENGTRVLEIGTGTGYSTALMCHRLGDRNVTSIEYDAGLAARAARRLRSAGWEPRLVVGDGLGGHKEGADYDTIVATCSVRHIPAAWLWQVAEGGSITTTISGWMLASGLVRLAVGDDGTASGRFTGDKVGYMLARPHERPPQAAFFRRPGTVRPCRFDPALLHEWTPSFLAQLAAPSAELMTSGDDVILRDTATGSQAWTESAPGGWSVHQHGPLRLWDQVESALAAWQSAGAPEQSGFRLTVASDLTQAVWLGDPDGPSWPLPV